MKKLVIGLAAAAVLAVVLGTAGWVYAQAPRPGSGNGYGGMMGGFGGRGGMMGQRGNAGTQYGFMHDDMITAFAQKLGLSADEVNARLAKGETMAQIAASKGFGVDQFQALMTEARSQALDQAVKEGQVTQAQADWMKQRGAGMMAGGRGMRGGTGNSGCPYFSQPQQ